MTRGRVRSYLEDNVKFRMMAWYSDGCRHAGTRNERLVQIGNPS